MFLKWMDKHHDTIANYLTAIAMIGGIVDFLYQYHEKNAAEERHATFELVQRYYQEPVVSARRVIEQMWFNGANNERLNRAKGGAAKEKVIVETLDRTPTGPQSLLILLDFFQGVAACVDSRACDDVVACSIFRLDARAIDDTYAAIFQRWQNSWGAEPNAAVKRFVSGCHA